MKRIEGDLIALALAGHFDVIVHGCNCHCSMGAGIAYNIKQAFPEAFEADLATTKGNRAKLGTLSSATIVRGDVTFSVVNAYTQFHWHGPGVLADYDAIRSAMRLVKEQYAGKRIGYPRIGAGMAKGDWTLIAAIIRRALEGEDHTVVELPDP